METFFKLFTTLSILLATLSPLSAQNDILASVNEEAITLGDVIKRSSQKEQEVAKKLSGEQFKKAVEEIRLSTLNDMIVELLLKAEYNHNQFPIPNHLVKSIMSKLSTQRGHETLGDFEAAGNSLLDLEQEAKELIGSQTLLSEHTSKAKSVSPKQAFEYYNSNAEKFIIPKLYSMQLLFISAKEKSPEVYGRQVVECADIVKSNNADQFTEAVKKYSSAPNSKSGGSLDYMPLKNMRKEFHETIKSMSVAEFKGPLIFPAGTYYLHLKGIKESEKRAFKDVANAIQNFLRNKKYVDAKAEYIKELKTKHTVKINKK